MRIFVSAIAGRDRFDGRSKEVVDQFRANVHLEEFLGSMFEPLTDDEVRGVQAPTLLVTGEQSPGAILDGVDRLEVLMPHTRRVEIPAVSHGLFMDEPEAFIARVLPLLGSTPAR